MKTLKKLLYCILMFGLLLAVGSTAAAQTLEKKSLTLDGAERVIAAAKAEASKVKAPGGVIAVVDSGGNLMALERLDGTFAAGENISMISVLRLAWTIMSPSLLIPMNYSLHCYVGSSRAIEPAQRLRVQSQYRVCPRRLGLLSLTRWRSQG